MARALARLDGAGELNRAAEQQQLFRQRGLASIGVGNYGKGTPAGDIAQQVGGYIRRVHLIRLSSAIRFTGDKQKPPARRRRAAGMARIIASDGAVPLSAAGQHQYALDFIDGAARPVFGDKHARKLTRAIGVPRILQ